MPGNSYMHRPQNSISSQEWQDITGSLRYCTLQMGLRYVYMARNHGKKTSAYMKESAHNQILECI